MRLSFYDFMSIMDKFCIEEKDLDFRELTVHCNKVNDVECLFIKDKDGEVIDVFVLNANISEKLVEVMCE